MRKKHRTKSTRNNARMLYMDFDDIDEAICVILSGKIGEYNST